MRIAQIVEQIGGNLPLPEAFRKTLGLYEESQLFWCRLKNASPELAPVIVTTIPPRSWRTTFRILVRLEHRVGQLSSVAQILSEQGVNILLMEGYGYHPEERGWWNSVIDFPDLHKCENQSEIKKKVVDLLGKFAELYPGATIRNPSGDCVEPEPIENLFDFDRVDLISPESKLKVRIEPMRLQGLVKDLAVNPDAVPVYVVEKKGIKLTEIQAPRGKVIRKLLMCNTEERFVRLVGISDPAEIELEVYTDSADSAPVGVGVLSELSLILRNFVPRSIDKRPFCDAGVNIAFTYNYITAYGAPPQGGEQSSETGRVKFFLESPIPDRSEEDQLRIWKELFEELMDARRGKKKNFVISEESSMIVWRSKDSFVGNEARKAVQEHFWHRTRDWFLASKRARSVFVFLAFLLLAIVAFLFRLVYPASEEGAIIFHTCLLSAVLNFIAIFVPGIGHG